MISVHYAMYANNYKPRDGVVIEITNMNRYAGNNYRGKSVGLYNNRFSYGK